MAGRKITDEGEARDALDSIGRTGLELADWCRARGIDPRSLSGWRGVLEARGYEPPALEFVELVPRQRPSATMYYVRCGDFTVDVAHDFDEHVLGRLLRLVATC